MVHLTTSARLGAVIETALEDAGITLRRVEDTTGISRTTLTRRLRKGGFNLDELEALAVVLDTTVVALLEKVETAA